MLSGHGMSMSIICTNTNTISYNFSLCIVKSLMCAVHRLPDGRILPQTHSCLVYGKIFLLDVNSPSLNILKNDFVQPTQTGLPNESNCYHHIKYK